MNKTKKIITLALLAVSLFAIALPAFAAPATINMGGTAGAATVRSTGSSSGGYLGTIGTGSTIETLSTVNANGYTKIRIINPKNGTITQSGLEGWVLDRFISYGSSGGYKSAGDTCTINGTDVRARTGAGLGYPIAFITTNGEQGEILWVYDVYDGYRWYEIEFFGRPSPNNVGFVRSDLVR